MSKKPAEWYALWRFNTTEDAIAALGDLHISLGVGDDQGMGCIADSLEDGECVTICGAGGMVEVCLSFPYDNHKARGAWISPCELEHQTTFDLKGEDTKGAAYRWGSR